MAKYLVGGSVTFKFKLEVEASSEDEAIDEVESMMNLDELADGCDGDCDVECDYADAVVGPRGTVTKTA